MSLQQRVGPNVQSDGTPLPLRGTRDGATATSDAHGRFQEAVMRGNTYLLSAGAATPSAYTGGAAGTPLLAIHNPANSGKALVVLLVANGITTDTTATTTSTTGELEAYVGPSSLPTGTTTAPLNLLTQQTSGSIAKGFVNTALTGSTALSFALPLSYFTARSNATVIVAEEIIPTWTEVAGLLVAIPGNEVAVGYRAVPTGIVADCAMIWEEVPYP